MTGEHVRRSTRGGAAGFRVGGEIAVLAIGVVLVGLGRLWGEPYSALGSACAVAAAASIVLRAAVARRRAVRSGQEWAEAGRPGPDAAAVLLREQTRTAGELSDVLGRLSLISMYASKLELDPARIGRGDDEVRSIRRTAAVALEELRTAVDQLGGADPAGVPASTAAPPDVLELVDRSRASGLPVQLTWLGGADAVGDPVAHREVRRVLEEALDGAGSQAPGATAAITVTQSADQVRVVVLNGADDAGDHQQAGGSDLAHVRNRIEALGGRVSTETSLDGTFRLTAVVPRRASGRRPGAPAPRTRRALALAAVAVVVMLVAGGAWYIFGGARAGLSDALAPVGADSAASVVPTTSPAPTAPPKVEVDVRFTGNTAVIGNGSACDHDLNFEARIRVSRGPVTVRYAWIRSDDAAGPQETVDFPGTGPQEQVVRTSWLLGEKTEGWQAVQLIAPVAAVSDRAPFSFRC